MCGAAHQRGGWGERKAVKKTNNKAQCISAKSFSNMRAYSSASSPSPEDSLAFERLRLVRPARPPPRGEVRAKSMCFWESRRTTKEGTSTICLPTLEATGGNEGEKGRKWHKSQVPAEEKGKRKEKERKIIIINLTHRMWRPRIRTRAW